MTRLNTVLSRATLSGAHRILRLSYVTTVKKYVQPFALALRCRMSLDLWCWVSFLNPTYELRATVATSDCFSTAFRRPTVLP
jgi:hypothetical protein